MRDLVICIGIGMNMFFPTYITIPKKPKVKHKGIFVERKVDSFKGHQTTMYNRTQNK